LEGGEGGRGDETTAKKVIIFGENRVSPSVDASGDTNVSDDTDSTNTGLKITANEVKGQIHRAT